MMKKIPAVIIGIMLSSLIMTGCGNSTDKALDSKETVETMGVLQWPDHELAKLLPLPASNTGEVEWAYMDEINICVGNTTKEDYLRYKQACAENGFKTVISEENDSFYVNNEDGYRLSLFHNKNNEMTINIKEPLCDVKIDTKCIYNLLFNKHDLTISVDGKEIGMLEHGDSGNFEIQLEKGMHTFTVNKEGDSSISGELDFKVPEEQNLRYEFICKKDMIEIKSIDRIALPIKKEELLNKSYEEVETILRDAGFNKIEFSEIKDLSMDDVENAEKIGMVTAISFNGNAEFTDEDKFYPETEILIEYHSELEFNAPFTTDTAQGISYHDVVKAFEESGFENIEVTEKIDSQASGNEDGTVYRIYIEGTDARSDRTYKADSSVEIAYYVITLTGRSETELSYDYAKKAFEEYGKANYRYGFKCHWVMDLIHREQLSDGSWYMKVGVTIKNAYGTEYKTVAEGIVDGSDAYPVVQQFYVS